MADRNDELLLALGWTQFKHRWTSQHADRPGKRIAQSYYKYRNLAGEIVSEKDRPRPYDNLQDAVDCVPEGKEGIIYLAVHKWFSDGRPGGEHPNKADLPEALAGAILEAVK